jgi:hypothetical protein
MDPVSEHAGGAPVAQRAALWFERGAVAALLTVCLALGAWASARIIAACAGEPGMPLDDSYIHFQFARSFARLRPLEYVPGEPAVAGATSLLWPLLLALPTALGASPGLLIVLTWLLGFGALFGQAYEAFRASQRFMSSAFALSAGVLVLSLSANTWFAASGMEVVPLGYVLLRSARRAAEYLDGAVSQRRALELVLLSFAGALLRPEGAICASYAAVALLFGRAARQRKLAAGAFLAPMLPAAFAWLVTGSAAQTTARVKWLPLNPYYEHNLWAAVAQRLEVLFGVLMDGRVWAWTFIPEGYRLLVIISPVALFGLAWARGARAHGGFLLALALSLLLTTSYETFLVNRLRYLWPFSAPWLMGIAALAQLIGLGLERFRPSLRQLALALPALACFGLLKLMPVSLDDLATSARAITAQQVSLGRWAAHALAKNATIGLNDAGAITYFSSRKTFDVVGLTTAGEARYWVAGPGSRFEHYERLGERHLPTHFIVYPEWFGLPELMGLRLTERYVPGASILGGPLMVACEADYSLLGSGSLPERAPQAALLDELDIADLESEAAHAYELGRASVQENIFVAAGRRADGGRSARKQERFELVVEGGGSLVIRLGAAQASSVRLFLDGRPVTAALVPPRAFQELELPLPLELPRARRRITLLSQAPLEVFHYWSYARP